MLWSILTNFVLRRGLFFETAIPRTHGGLNFQAWDPKFSGIDWLILGKGISLLVPMLRASIDTPRPMPIRFPDISLAEWHRIGRHSQYAAHWVTLIVFMTKTTDSAFSRLWWRVPQSCRAFALKADTIPPPPFENCSVWKWSGVTG